MDFFTIPTLYATYNPNFKRYEKKLFLAGAILVMSAAAVVGYKVYNQSQMSAFMKANIEALSFYESRNCPEPYDVYNHQLHYDTRQGMFYVDGQGDVNILGKKIRVGGVYIGANVKIDYIILYIIVLRRRNQIVARLVK